VGFAGLFVGAADAANKPQAQDNSAAAAIRSEHQEPINVTGKETIYESGTDTFTVRGDAVMTQGPSVLRADEIKVDRKQRIADAIGHVHLIDPELELWASEAKINVVDETMELTDAKIIAKKNTYHVEGRKIIKHNGQNYTIQNGFFTTCGCSTTPEWSITADQMDVDVGKSGTAKGASFDVLGVPIVKLPFAEFPANSDRHTGFLSGRYGQSGLRGFQIFQPFYLDISKSSDATVALDVETSQRVGGMAEYRLTNGKDDYFWSDGSFYNESIRSESNRAGDIIDNQIADAHIPIDRFSLIAMTRQHLTDNLMVYGDAISVSDSLFLREMNVWTLSRGFGGNFGSLRNAASHFGILDELENGFVRLQGTWNQDLIQDQSFALQRLPDFLFSGRKELLGQFAFLDYDAEAVNFYRDQGVAGGRLNTNPRITVPWRWGDYLYGYATGGSYAMLYDTHGPSIQVIPVGTNGLTYNNQLELGPPGKQNFQVQAVPYFQTGVSSLLERVFDVNIGSIEKLKHTIEPFVNYAYVPRVTQSPLPLFDQYDRINSRSLVTYGVTTRLFAKMLPPPPQEEENPPGQSTSVFDEATGNEQQPPDGQALVGPYNAESQPSEALAPAGATTYSRGSEVQELAQLTVMQAYDTSHQISLQGGRVSDIESILQVFPTSVLSAGSQVDYNPRSHAGITYATTYLSLQPPWSESQSKSKLYMGRMLQGSFVQLGYSYVNPSNTAEQSTSKNSSQFATMRAYTDLFDTAGIYFAPSYDLAAGKLLSAEYGARIKSPCDCWAADFGLVQSYNPNEVQVQFQLTLGGLGSVGRSPFGRNPFQTMGLVGQPTGVLPRY
jgi:lipopolysaccharide assembly outer membrane protein LptD (OstA)